MEPALSTTVPMEARSGTWVSRIAWLIFFSVPLAVLVTAATLTPDPSGHGTHMQLGLPPCGFLLATGLPCPGCGLTTCFAHMIRFQVVGAVHANAFGVPLFLVSVLAIPVSANGFLRGHRVIDTLERLHFEKIAVGLSLCAIVVWGVKLATLLAR